jgi:cytochrome c oxidase subunit 1
MGGADGVYNHIMWVFWQPTLYAFAIPVLGIVADIVPVFGQRRLQRHSVAMFAIGLFGALSFGAWANVAVTGLFDEIDPQPTPWLYKGPWVAVSFIVVVPLLMLLGLWALTLKSGKVKLGSPLLFALVSGLLLLLGVAGGIGTAIEGLDVDGTTWMTAQSYAVLLAALTAGFGALAYWAPKLYGRMLSEASSRLTATLLLIGTAVLVVPYAIAGLLDQPRLLDFDIKAIQGDVSTVETLNTVSAVGGVIVMAGLLLGIIGVLGAVIGRKGTGPGDDPWAGHTLEWTTSSPPPAGNFPSLLEITSEAPLYDARHAELRATTEAS